STASHNRIRNRRKTRAQSIDHRIEIDAREPRANLLTDRLVIELRPFGGFTLTRPEKSEKAPVLRLCRAAPGQRRVQQILRALIGGVGFGDRLPNASLPLLQQTARRLQKRFLDPV